MKLKKEGTLMAKTWLKKDGKKYYSPASKSITVKKSGIYKTGQRKIFWMEIGKKALAKAGVFFKILKSWTKSLIIHYKA